MTFYVLLPFSSVHHSNAKSLGYVDCIAYANCIEHEDAFIQSYVDYDEGSHGDVLANAHCVENTYIFIFSFPFLCVLQESVSIIVVCICFLQLPFFLSIRDGGNIFFLPFVYSF